MSGCHVLNIICIYTHTVYIKCIVIFADQNNDLIIFAHLSFTFVNSCIVK